MDSLPEDAPAPRLCHLIKWPDFDGYGFNLHGEKSKPGQYIGKVDKDSPADLAGLKANDRILEVNGTNISNENHKQVVTRIKAIANETKLLVVDEKADQYYKAKNIVLSGSMSNVEYLVTPVPRPNSTAIELTQVENVTLNNGSIQSEDADEDGATHISDSHSGSGSSSPSKNNSLKKPSSRMDFRDDDEGSSFGGPSPTPPASSPSASPSPVPMSIKPGFKSSNDFLDLNMTAQEMRAKLAAKKKDKMDPKNQKIDLRKKYDIIQTL